MAEYTVDNLAVEIESSAEKGIQAFDLLISKSKTINSNLATMSSHITTVKAGYQSLINTMNGVTQGGGKVVNTMNKLKETTVSANSEAKKLKTSLDGLSKTKDSQVKVDTSTNDTTKDTSKSFNSLLSISKAVIAFKAVKRVTDATIGSAIDMTENYNLFNVAMGKSEEKALSFQKTLNSTLGVNFSNSMRYQGFFQSLAENLGIASDGALIMSESLTKLTYDLSSLYNMDVDSVYGKIQSALVGQTKPARMLGADVTAQTLQGYIDNFGWDVQIQEMTQAEKVLLRYIALLDQTKLAQGDMARTLESPANQLRVFNELLQETGAWIGTVFLGGLSKVMAFANGFLMVVKELAKGLATLMGFSLGDFDFGGGIGSVDYGDLADDIDGVGNSADKAGKKMNSLLKFNEINNIQTPSATSGSTGGGSLGNGAYYDQLTEKLAGYDNLMGNVNSKAKEIRDTLFEWLGIDFDEKFGILSWNFKDMATSAKLATIAIGAFAGIKLLTTIGPWVLGLDYFIDGLKNVFLAMKNWGIVNTLFAGIATKLNVSFGAVAAGFSTLAIVAGVAVGAFLLVKEGLKPSIEAVDELGGVSEKTRKLVEPFMESYEDLNNTVTRLDWADAVITQEDVNKISTGIDSITKMMNDELVSDLEDMKSKIEDENYFNGLDPLAKKELLANIQSSYDKIQKENEDNAKKMKAIYQKASDEHRGLTEDEQKTVNAIQEKMLKNGIEALSDNQKDQDTILRNIKNNAEKLSAEQASAIVKDSLETKNRIIQDAQSRYAEEMRIADQLWERGDITKAQYDEMTKSAKDSYDKQVQDAEKNHNTILEKAKEHSGKYINHIDWSNGEIKNNFQKLWDQLSTGWVEGWKKAGEAIYDGIQKSKDILNRMKQNMSDWWSNSIAPWFTKEKWAGLISGALDSFKNTMSSKWATIQSWFGSNIKLPKISFPSFSLPTFSVSGGSWNPIDWVQGKGIPKINISWVKAYATGGFPEDGLFMANSSELVGQFSNGKTAVANNNQIISGIQRGVSEAIRPLVQGDGSNNNNSRYMEVTVMIEGGVKLGKVLIDTIDQTIVQGGVVPKTFG